MHISMHPAQVRGWGEHANEVGDHVRAQRGKVSAAGEEPAPVDAFAFSDAYGDFFDTWTGIVGGLGHTIDAVGDNLKRSASTVAEHDDDGAGALEPWGERPEHQHPRRPFIGPKVPVRP